MIKIHFLTAWEYMRRSPFQAMAAIMVLANTFFVATILAILIYASNQTIVYFETRPQVIAFLKDDVGGDEIAALQNKLEGDFRVKDVTFVSKEQALEIYKSATEDNPLLTELVDPSVFPASLDFSVADLNFVKEVMDEVKADAVVDEVCFTASLDCQEGITDVIDNLRTVTRYIRIGGGIFAAFLLFSSFLVLTVIISLRLNTRRTEIEILDLIGATKGFIRKPIFIEGILYTVFGVLLGWMAALVLILYATPSIISYFGEIPILPRDTVDLLTLFVVVLGVLLILGILLAVMGSSMAVARVRKTK